MPRRSIAILALAAIAVQAVFGGLRAGASICLGGGHEHHEQEVAATCDRECDHHAPFPAPVPIDEHHHDCECTDVRLSFGDAPATLRADSDLVPQPLVAPPWDWGGHDAAGLRAGPIRDRLDDPGGGDPHVLRTVRVTRLII